MVSVNLKCTRCGNNLLKCICDDIYLRATFGTIELKKLGRKLKKEIKKLKGNDLHKS